jgi:hypothetical protein
MSILEKLKRAMFRPFDRGDHSVESERGVENPDALAATGGRQSDPSATTGHSGYPPGYVKQDDGRPRH